VILLSGNSDTAIAFQMVTVMEVSWGESSILLEKLNEVPLDGSFLEQVSLDDDSLKGNGRVSIGYILTRDPHNKREM
jgi:hypothetical protein